MWSDFYNFAGAYVCNAIDKNNVTKEDLVDMVV